MPKQIALSAGVLSVLLLFAAATFCQNEVIVHEKLIEARSLSGQVHIGDSPGGVKGVLVEDCTADWSVVKASTYTDDKGHFNFPNASAKHVHYLRLSIRGAHTLQVRVKIDRSGQKELSLALTFGT